MMKLIPNDAKQFYVSILNKQTADFEDDIDAFSVPEVDFVVEKNTEEIFSELEDMFPN